MTKPLHFGTCPALVAVAERSRPEKFLLRTRVASLLAAIVLLAPLAARGQLPATIDLASGAEDVTIYGFNLAASMTANGALVVGDLNADGIDDLIIGSRRSSIGRSVAGEASVYFGGASLTGVRDVAGLVGVPPDVTIYGATAGDNLTGQSGLAIGDFNGDGIDDLALGAWNARGPSEDRIGAGEAYIVYGAATLPSTIDLNGSGAFVTIYGATSGDFLTLDGIMIVGDFDNDGADDLVLGSHTSDGPSESRDFSGEAYIIYGSDSLPATIDLKFGEEDVIIYGGTTQDQLMQGGSLAVGDLNDDGVDDLILGASGASADIKRLVTGLVYIVYGLPGAVLPGTIDLADSDEDVTIYSASSSSGGGGLSFGGTLAVADLNGDGRDDLILGSPFADGPMEGRPNAGEAYVIYGSDSLPATIDLDAGAEDVIIYGASAEDNLARFGSLDVGDFNGDGIDDLLLGAPRANGPSESRFAAGEAYVIYGSLSLPSTIDLNSGAQDVTIYGATTFDHLTDLGQIVIGDFNDDGADDIVLGSALADGPSENREDSGEAYLIYGSASLPSIIDLNSSGEDVTIFGATPGDRMTGIASMIVGDLNADGVVDLVLGSSSADGPSETRSNSGEAYVIFGLSGDRWVDFAYNGTETGTILEPFNTLQEGVNAVSAGRIVNVKGNTADNDSNETLVINKAVTIRAVGGPVAVGGPPTRSSSPSQGDALGGFVSTTGRGSSE